MQEEEAMNLNWDTVRGNWKQVKGEAKRQWGKLTDDDMMQLEGSREKLVGKIQERYGLTKEAAEHQVEDWARKLPEVPRA
jgi:uncharacterized protein YjbJ (UPF0337 family)